ncbi:MAG: hypothetical protein KIS87_00960 [Phycisphaeraceae bacterium]|nr:hypothetical protein [Phycisphaeraceae bacterium]
MPSDVPEPNFEPDAVLRGWLAGRDVPCPECGYNLCGTDGRACPECGVAIAAAIVLGRRADDHDGPRLPAEPAWLLPLAFMIGSAAVNAVTAGAILVRGGWIVLFDPPYRGDPGMAIVPAAAFGLLLLGVLNGAMIYGWIVLRDRWGELPLFTRLAVAALAIVCCGTLVSWPLIGA